MQFQALPACTPAVAPGELRLSTVGESVQLLPRSWQVLSAPHPSYKETRSSRQRASQLAFLAPASDVETETGHIGVGRHQVSRDWRTWLPQKLNHAHDSSLEHRLEQAVGELEGWVATIRPSKTTPGARAVLSPSKYISLVARFVGCPLAAVGRERVQSANNASSRARPCNSSIFQERHVEIGNTWKPMLGRWQETCRPML